MRVCVLCICVMENAADTYSSQIKNMRTSALCVCILCVCVCVCARACATACATAYGLANKKLITIVLLTGDINYEYQKDCARSKQTT